MIDAVILIDIDVVSPEGVASVLRVSDRPLRPFPPGDATAPNVAYDERLIEPPTLRRALFDDLATLSPGLGYGDLTLANGDRGLDVYQGYAWGEVRVDRWTPGTPRAAAVRIMTALAEAPAFDVKASATSKVRLPLYDYRAELDRPLQETLYAGGNNGTTVLYEGEESGLLGRPKPLGYGLLDNAHVPAPQVNGAVLAYQVHDGPVDGPIEIYDRGDDAGFIDDGDFSGAAFDAHTPAAAHSATDLGRGLVKMNGNPVGQVAFGFKAAASGPETLAGGILAELLAKAGVPSGRIDPDMADTPGPTGMPGPQVGAWFADAVSARDAIGWVAKAIPAAVLPGRNGVWEAMALDLIFGVADHQIIVDDILDLEADSSAPGPAGEVRVGYGRIYTRYRDADLAPALAGTADVARLTAEYRWKVAEDATAKARHPRTWRTISITTPIVAAIDADEAAILLMNVFGLRSDGRPRRMWRITLEMTDARLEARLGEKVEVAAAPWGVDGIYLLVGEELMRPSRDRVIWTVWG